MLKAIIIDDEPSCIDTLQLMLQKKFTTEVKIVGTTTSPSAGIQLIEKHQPNIIFLDVEMPEMTGIELLQSLNNINFNVVFTTAHQHYAIQAIKLNALDYLTKPINLTELDIAIKKCSSKQSQNNNQQLNHFLQQYNGNTIHKISLTMGTATQFVPINEIVRIESQSNYSTIYFTNKSKQLVTKTLKDLEEQLAPHNFLRVHHSHLINIEHVIGYKNQDSGYLIMQGNEVVEISRRKKQEVLQRLKM